jgi:hypothetical protein
VLLFELRIGILSGQLLEDTHKGRWADPHNARPAYYCIMVRGLTALFDVLPVSDPDRESIANSILAAMQARNPEFTCRGIINVDSSLEAILLFQALSPEQRQAVGSCHADEALAILERHCVTRLGKNQGRFSPGAGGDYFEYIVQQRRR